MESYNHKPTFAHFLLQSPTSLLNSDIFLNTGFKITWEPTYLLLITPASLSCSLPVSQTCPEQAASCPPAAGIRAVPLRDPWWRTLHPPRETPGACARLVLQTERHMVLSAGCGIQPFLCCQCLIVTVYKSVSRLMELLNHYLELLPNKITSFQTEETIVSRVLRKAVLAQAWIRRNYVFVMLLTGPAGTSAHLNYHIFL